jgi:hypothetical protein
MIFNYVVATLLVVVAVVQEIISVVGKQRKKSLYFAAVGQSDELLASEKDTLKARMLEKDPPAQAPSLQPARLHYMDFLRTISIETVMIVHTLTFFCGVHRRKSPYPFVGSYRNPVGAYDHISITLAQAAMPVFFFVSGYVTPGSLKRKGRLAFIKDRLRRLGLPLAVSMFVINALISGGIEVLLNGKGAVFHYSPFLGVAWFLNTLLVISIVYASIADDDVAAARGGLISPLPCPGWYELFLWTTAASAVWIFAEVVCGSQAVYFTNTFQFTSLPTYVLYFAAGCLAKTHNWLDQIPDKLGDRRVSFGIFVAWTATLIVVPFMMYGYVSSLEATYPSNAGDDGHGNDNDDKPGDFKWTRPLDSWPYAIYLTVGIIAYGIFTMLLMVCALQLSPSFLNFTSPFWKVIHRVALPVYLLHYTILSLYFYIWLKIMTLEGFYPYFVNNISSTKLPSDLDLLWGAVFVFVCTNLTVWPIGVILTKIPYLNTIL